MHPTKVLRRNFLKVVRRAVRSESSSNFNSQLETQRKTGGTNGKLRLLNTLLSDNKIARIKLDDLGLGVESSKQTRTE
jgi:hypothetical protein